MRHLVVLLAVSEWEESKEGVIERERQRREIGRLGKAPREMVSVFLEGQGISGTMIHTFIVLQKG